MKKFLLKLVNWQAQRTGPKRFHQPDVIQGEQAREHSLEAMEDQREKLRDEGKNREVPSDSNILGPSESEKVPMP